MSRGITWYTLEEAVATYSLKTSLILKWAERGELRAEQADTRLMRVNAADLEHRMQNVEDVREVS